MNEYSARVSPLWLRLALVALAVALAVAMVPAWRHLREPSPVPPRPLRASWTAPPGLTVGAGAEYPFGLAVSPDGRRVVFPAAREGRVQLWLQDLARGATDAVPHTEGAALPFWSPDGTRVGFFASGRLQELRLDDARIAPLHPVAHPRGASWSTDGTIVFTDDEGGLSIVAADGSGGPDGGGRLQPRVLTRVDTGAGEIAHAFPVFLADGAHLVMLVRADSAARQGLYLVTVADGTRTRLTGAASSGLPASDQLVFANDGALVSQHLDVAARRLTGRPAVLAPRVGETALGQLLVAAAADTLIFSELMRTDHELVWMSRAGERLGTLGSPADFWSARIAPDGKRVATTILDPLLRTLDVVQFDGRSLMPSRVSLSIDADESPAWSPDGLRIAWVQAGHAVMVRGAGAVLPAETIARFAETVRVTDWSPDGTAVLVSRAMADTRDDLWLVPVRGGAPRPVVSTPFADVQGDLSPDGRWIAYASDESGQWEVYVEGVQDRAPEPGTRERVSSGGGSDPRWSRDGQELFFRRGSEIRVATPASGRGQNAVATTSMVLETEMPVRSFDVAPDGDRFLLSLPATAPPPAATVVVNWHPPPATAAPARPD